jgi:hypothetical protein
MEQRRVEGQPTGGAFSGRRLSAGLEPAGFRLIGAGRSDWQVGPARDRPAPAEPQGHGTAVFLQALLGMIAGEGLRAGDIDLEKLENWYKRRSADLQAGRLGLTARNLDLLAERV